MSDKKHTTDNFILSTLRRKGFIVPKSEEEVEAFEKALEEHTIPPLPKELDDPDALLKRSYSQPRNMLAKDEDQDATNLARAARQGKAIPPSVLKKMKKDRDDAEKEI